VELADTAVITGGKVVEVVKFLPAQDLASPQIRRSQSLLLLQLVEPVIAVKVEESMEVHLFLDHLPQEVEKHRLIA
jgi:hypothetical protein